MFQVGGSKNAKKRYIVVRQLETQFKRNSNIELKKHQSGGKKAGKGARLVQTTPDTLVFLGTAPSINRKAPPLQLLRSRQSDEWALLLRTTFSSLLW